ncbi:hypothetical protein B6D60_07255 [candidate division KSB1 bacterium 4484_87]|nr:MAG: hypothetical protein B6D60_07255 [candidate division KSB1 bacterium 4484_87]
MKKKLFLLGLIFLTIINLSALGTITYHRYCQRNAACPMNKTENLRGQALCQNLELTDDQIKQMREMSHIFHAKTDTLADILQVKRLGLLDLLKENHASKDQILAYVNDINELQKKLQFEVINYLLNQKEILTPKQQQKLEHLIEQRLKRETIHFKSTGFDFIEGTCNHKCENSNQIDTLKLN